ncbi:hypothetical protein DOTSEDRAFT_85243 [Dothistroma septosporum NZE10]|uniref:Fe-containing alcohol dehydrogenase-like C-terminal domain-containing protein n=1 Tax=Dothistroma septosporum (strain NZE10 / CBS 128990) TaxID=675120 RepID=N1Q4X5_DOTSN|nr:hypothetical protein DOTSEDRAFT_85243 [Dothistroma septosporum NZE10]
MHTPINVTDKALTYAKEWDADCLGEVTSIRTDLPHISSSMTYTNSEMTSVLCETTDGKIRPDVDFTMTLPPALSAASGINATAHAVAALYARSTNPIMKLLVLEGTKSLTKSLQAIDLSNLPHAKTHTIVLPHVIAYNAPEIPNTWKKLAEVMPESDSDAVEGPNVRLTKLKKKRGLKDFGMKEDDVERAAEITVDIEKEPLRETIKRCWAGEDARADL